MKRFLAALLLAVFCAACAPEPSEIVIGATIQSVEDVGAEAAAASRFDEHPLAPDAGEEVVVRLDDGATLIVPNIGHRRLEAGQRVRVVVGSHGAFLL